MLKRIQHDAKYFILFYHVTLNLFQGLFFRK